MATGKLLKTLSGLKGKVIANATHVQGVAYLKFQNGDYVVLRDGKPVHDLNFEDQVQLGLVTKADLEALKRLKKLGLAMDAPAADGVKQPKECVYVVAHSYVQNSIKGIFKLESEAAKLCEDEGEEDGKSVFYSYARIEVQ